MAESILSRLDLSLDDLPHPVELLTIEAAAREADVAPTTVTSAINSESFRHLVMVELVTRIGVRPGSRCWSALQTSLGAGATPEHTVATIFDRRAHELSEDPSLPYFVSGFDHSNVPGLLAALGAASDTILFEFYPLLQVALAPARCALPADPPKVITEGMMVFLLGEAFRRLVEGDAESTQPSVLAGVFTRWCLAHVEPVVGGPLLGPIPMAGDVARRPASSALTRAVGAGADLLCRPELEAATPLKIADVCQRAGVGVSAFYRAFPSMEEFHRQAIASAGQGDRALRAGSDGYRSAVEKMISMTAEEALEYLFSADNGEAIVNLTEGRRGHRLWPWLGTNDIPSHVRAIHRRELDTQMALLAQLRETFGLELRPGLTPEDLVAVNRAFGAVAEMFIRLDPDRPAAVARSRQHFVRVFRSTHRTVARTD